MGMILFERAYEIVMDSSFSTGTETIPFSESAGRILAGNVVSDTDMPPFNKASVDGFACRRSDLNAEMEIIESIPAGIYPVKAVGENQCSRIMTGAVVPEGADCVLMVEDSEILSSGKVSYIGKYSKDNIAYRGEDIRRGDVVLSPGRIIKPQDIALMASLGYISATVSKLPRMAIISSGSELVEPHLIPGDAQLRNSNSSQLMAQAQECGLRGNYYGIARDDEEETYSIVSKAISENDIVIITGGVSTGDYDFIPSVLKKAGVKLLFTRVAVQPGKPTTFGITGNTFIFGLPGNPVSSFLQFELLVRPLVYKMMGHLWKPLQISLPLKEDISRRSADRMNFLPVVITGDGMIVPVEYHGSAHISALADAFGIISMPVGTYTLKKGELVSVRQI